jgi:hypothetical protein
MKFFKILINFNCPLPNEDNQKILKITKYAFEYNLNDLIIYLKCNHSNEGFLDITLPLAIDTKNTEIVKVDFK